MTAGEPRSRSWTVHGLCLEALCWGDPEARPLLCLHGWLDNAASFSVLAPLLPEYHVIALDLTGHGLSSHRSADAGYQVWDDLPEIQAVVDDLGWDQFSLLGHSRGAIIATLFASTFARRVRRLVLLDALMPAALPEKEFPVQMARFVNDKKRLLSRDTRVYPTQSDAIASRINAGLEQGAARLIAQRNLQACDGGYTWTTDPRLRGASAAKLTAGQIQAVLEALSMPTLLMLADDGHGKHPQLQTLARDYIQQLSLAQVAGKHHFHMEAGVDKVALRIREFLN